MKEWPLIVFTLATQFACGLALAAVLFDTQAGAAGAERMRPLAIAIFPVVALGILVSMAHLGRPLQAWRALANLGRSRLSREVGLTLLFALLALAYSSFWWMGRVEGRVVLGACTSLAAVAAVVAQAAIYTIPTQPAWNSGWVPASFLGTTLLLGGLAPAVLMSWGTNTGLLRVFLGATLAGSLLLLVAMWWMMAALSHRTDPFTADRLAGLLQSLASRKAFILGCYIVLSIVLPAAVAFRLWPQETPGTTTVALIVLPSVVSGTAIGRAVMYWLGRRYESF